MTVFFCNCGSMVRNFYIYESNSCRELQCADAGAGR